MTQALRRSTMAVVAILALILAFLVINVPQAHASTGISGEVNSSSLIRNEDYYLTGTTTIYVDEDMPIGSISLNDYNLIIKGDNSHTLAVNGGITAYYPSGLSRGIVGVESGKLIIRMSDLSTARPAAIYTSIGGFIMNGGEVNIEYTNVADAASAKPAHAIEAATFRVGGGTLSVKCTSSNSDATAIDAKLFEVSGGSVTAWARTNASGKVAKGIGVADTISGSTDPTFSVSGGTVTATGVSASGNQGYGIDWTHGNSNAVATISGGTVKGTGEYNGIKAKALNISGSAQVEAQATKSNALRTEGTLAISDSGKVKAVTSETSCSAVSVKGSPNLGKHQKITTPSGGQWFNYGGYYVVEDSSGNYAQTAIIETIIPPSHTVGLACYDLTTQSLINSGTIQVCLNGSSMGAPSYEASIEEGDTYTISTTGVPEGWTWKGWRQGRYASGPYLNGGASSLTLSMGTEDDQYYAIFESPKTTINSLTFTTNFVPSVGDRALVPNVTVEEEGVRNVSAWWEDEYGSDLGPNHVFADGETAVLAIQYSIGDTYVLADDIASHVTVNGVAPTTFGGYWIDVKYYFQTQRWERLAGQGRYDTMAAIVDEGFNSCDWAVIATGDNFPDALAASALAGSKGCPVILTASKSLSPQAKAELKRLGVKHVYIMGGTGAVSQGVEDAITALNGGIDVEKRVFGAGRRDTSVEAMKIVAGESDTVIIATGEGYADTLSIGPWSYATCSPIVLTKADGTLDDSEVAAIREAGYTKYILVGGTGVVSDQVKDQLSGLTCVDRLGGKDRYATSQIIAEFSLANGLTSVWPAIATGGNYPDALAGAALCGSNRSIMVLVKNQDSAGIATLIANKARIRHGYVFGGSGVVSDSLMEYVDNATK